MNKYTEAIQGDDVVILCDGIPMGVGEILAALNAATQPADAALAEYCERAARNWTKGCDMYIGLMCAAAALRARPQAVAEGYAIAVPVGHLQCWENELNSAKTCIDSTLAWVSEYIKNHEDAKAMLAASQSATGGAK